MNINEMMKRSNQLHQNIHATGTMVTTVNYYDSLLLIGTRSGVFNYQRFYHFHSKIERLVHNAMDHGRRQA